MTDRKAILDYIAQQLDSLCERPEMWGPSLSVELQYLMLMEFWLVTTRPDLESQNPRLVMDEFHAFCKRAGHRANIPLAEHNLEPDEFRRLLLLFREEFYKRVTPRSPFEEYDLAVAYNLKKEQALSESIISHGLGNVRRVLRAVVRPERTRRIGGRSRKEIEALTDFEIVDVEVQPRNGIGARVVIPMRQQIPDQLDWSAQSELRDAIGSVVEMVEWASGSDNAPMSSNSPQKRDWIAWQTMRLIPSADVESMELGGKLIARSRPVILRASQRQRLLSVLENSLKWEAFSRLGTIRALNRDSAVLKFRAENSSGNVECWLVDPDDLRIAEQNLCAKVEVRGRIFTGVARKPVVLVDTLTVQERADDETDDGIDSDS